MGAIGFMFWFLVCGGITGLLYLFCKPVREFIKTGGDSIWK